MDNQNLFNKLSVAKKWAVISISGELVGKRVYRSFEIELYHFDLGFAEVWRGIGFQTMHWIELVNYDNVIVKYLDLIQIR